MQLNIFLFSASKKKRLEKLILPIKNWVASLQKGSKITLALKGEDPRCYVGSKVVEVVYYEEDETCANAWVDVGEELTKKLEDDVLKVTGWRGTFDPEPEKSDSKQVA